MALYSKSKQYCCTSLSVSGKFIVFVIESRARCYSSLITYWNFHQICFNKCILILSVWNLSLSGNHFSYSVKEITSFPNSLASPPGKQSKGKSFCSIANFSNGQKVVVASLTFKFFKLLFVYFFVCQTRKKHRFFLLLQISEKSFMLRNSVYF